MFFLNDYIGFAAKFQKLIENEPSFVNSKKGVELNILFLKRNEYPTRFLQFDENTPFVCSGTIQINNESLIGYDDKLIKELKLNNDEIYALVLHEIGHLISSGETSDELNKEMFCDNFAQQIIGPFAIINALRKIQSIQPDDISKAIDQRIAKILENTLFYRPEWVVGRYNSKHHVAIVYNLISGYSHFFESFSADVVAYILNADRNGQIDVQGIVAGTGISEDSIRPFLCSMGEIGIVSTKEIKVVDIDCYRDLCSERRKALYNEIKQLEEIEKNEPDAEQCYFDAVEEGNVITTATLELTYSCSERCVHCYNPGAIRNLTDVSHREDRSEMGIEDYRRIIDELYELGLVKLIITGGDPFSKPIIWDILDYVYRKNIAFDIYTNGYSITHDVDRLASLYPHAVGISIYSGIAEDHDAITRVKGSWKRSIEVAEMLSKLSVPLELKCCIMQPNIHSYYLVKDIADKLGACMQFEVNIVDSNDGDKCARQLRLTQDQLEIVLRDPYLGVYVGLDAPNFGKRTKEKDKNGCKAGGHSFCITPEGNLQPCCTFPMILGNVKDETIVSIISNNIELERWRKCTLNDYTECLKHEYCEYCSICSGQGYIQHRDYLKPPESSCYMAKARYSLAHKLLLGEDPLCGRNVYKAISELPQYSFDLKRIIEKG